jgi:hypothetical protein
MKMNLSTKLRRRGIEIQKHGFHKGNTPREKPKKIRDKTKKKRASQLIMSKKYTLFGI